MMATGAAAADGDPLLDSGIFGNVGGGYVPTLRANKRGGVFVGDKNLLKHLRSLTRWLNGRWPAMTGLTAAPLHLFIYGKRCFTADNP